jgi:hypothetical protein
MTKRLRTVVLLTTLVLVLVLAGSAIAGLFPRGASDERLAEVPLDGNRVRVEVLNGAGVPGLARNVTRTLRQKNFDVVFFGNAPAGRDSSVVIDRAGRPADAYRVAEALGITRVESVPDTSLYLEATVILGRDWNGSAPATPPE